MNHNGGTKTCLVGKDASGDASLHGYHDGKACNTAAHGFETEGIAENSTKGCGYFSDI